MTIAAEYTNGSDPVFTTRDELNAWAAKAAAHVRWNIQMAPDKAAAFSEMEKGMEHIKRVTIAHLHLPWPEETP